MAEIIKAPKIPCSKEEQETQIIISHLDKKAYVFTCASPMYDKLYALLEHPEAELCQDNKYGVEISVPMSWIKIRPPIKRNYTEEQRQAMGQRLADARKAKEETSESNLS